MIGHLDSLEGKVIDNPAVKNASIKVLVSPKEGWEGYVMRVLEVGSFGYTPKHQHPWPHINYIIEGEGELMIAGKSEKITAGSYAYVPGDTLHQFRNLGERVLKFICIVPEEGHQ
ncbi:MAG: cupin domain-containing protein [Acholeplasmataceae bacterium]|jgi:quercetin dioxygenase-like cupin family protein|nr:cupin domain-containing protein [Acholeplasmataceae bacterium]